MDNRQLKQALRHYFGYEDFRLHQEAIIHAVMSGKDVMAIMPTGGGKSICYQLPAILMSGVTIVISPLIALMKDQVDNLRSNGISAAYLNSTQSIEEQEYIKKQAINGQVRLLYVAPERLISKDQPLSTFLQAIRCNLFAIDEAHCISQWGHDFRPEYLKLASIKQQFPHIPVIALTASADKITQQDILHKLQLHQPAVYISSFNRSNIFYQIRSKKNALEQLAGYIDNHIDDCGIIYTLSRASTENLAARLREMGFIAAHYHAGMSASERNKVQDGFKKDQLKIIVATIAFGMGIDKPNVRYVIHYDVPKNMEGYYQETGRAGRDGLKSEAIMFYSSGDIIKLMQFTEIADNPEQSQIMLQKLRTMKTFAESECCRRQFILNYFGEEFPAYCGSCDFCVSNLENKEATIEAQKFLSAVYRTGERFGMDYIIDFLRGSDSKKINDAHKSLKTYGIGKELNKQSWQLIARQLLHHKMMESSGNTYPILKLNDTSWEILQGKKPAVFTIRKERVMQEEHGEITQHQELLQELKAIRRELAEQENVPAYIVFGDNTLQELATYLPLSFDEMKHISGLGDYKISKYGAALLEVIKDYTQRHQLSSKIKLKASAKTKPVSRPLTKTNVSTQATLSLFMEGYSIEEIAQQRSMSPVTIEGHLAQSIAVGELKAERVIHRDKLDKIIETIQIIGSDKVLKPIKDMLDDSFTYADIKMAVAHFQASSK